jgi:hypothetical protein
LSPVSFDAGLFVYNDIKEEYSRFALKSLNFGQIQLIMKLRNLTSTTALILLLALTSCKKNKPSYTIEGPYYGNFHGVFDGNDTIVNDGYLVQIDALDKSTALVKGTLFTPFEVLVTPNGLNIEPVSPTDGLTQFLFEGETEKLTFTYVNGDNTATYVGIKQ